MTVRWVLSGLLLALVMSSAPLTALPGPLAQSSSALASVPQTRGNEPASSAKIAANLAKTPLMFIENVGQFDQGARFRVQGADANLLLDDDALWYSVMEKPAPAAFGPKVGPQSDPLADTKQAPRKGVNLKVGFVGANPHPRIEPFNRLETHVSYFIGNDSSRWKSDVPVWGGVRYVDIYPGIDLEVTSENGHLVQRMVTKRKANLEAVRLRVEGADSLEVKEGRVQVKTAIGTLDVPGLKVQGTDGSIAAQAAKGPEVNGNVVIRPFSTSQPDSGLSAFSATDLLYSTFLGGSGYHYGYGIVVDSSGAAYVTGFTTSPWDPTTPGAFDPTWNGESDAFVTKLNPSGTQPVYSTYLGGGYWDEGRGIAVDSSGAAYVTGGTGSSDFPTTPAAFDTTINDSHSDGFVTKLQMLGPAVVDLPVILDSAYGGWTTGISIRNTSAGVANVQVLYYNSTGANVLTDNANIPANGFWGNYQGGRFGGNWAGSATILSTKPVTAIVNEVGPVSA
ncbi:MAG: SBBP repeat-containing protein, partial [Chloroflexi bacterium]|nr:SBBP repeat-containing protein [Chloroflexota bacterium]